MEKAARDEDLNSDGGASADNAAFNLMIFCLKWDQSTLGCFEDFKCLKGIRSATEGQRGRLRVDANLQVSREGKG